MAYTNMFNNSEKSLEGKVVVQLHPNTMPSAGRKALYYAKVTRTTADDAAVATEMVKHTDLVRFNDMTPIMSAFVTSVKTLLGQGNAVRISGLGTFYPKVVGGINTPAPTVADLGPLKVGFTNAEELHLAVADTEIAAIVDADTSPQIASVLDMDTMKESSITANKALKVKGKMMRLAGDASDSCGLYFAPENAAKTSYDTDETKWVRQDDLNVFTNKPGELLVKTPAALTSGTKYYIVIRTLCPASGGKILDDGTVDPACLIKTPRFGASEQGYEAN